MLSQNILKRTKKCKIFLREITDIHITFIILYCYNCLLCSWSKINFFIGVNEGKGSMQSLELSSFRFPVRVLGPFSEEKETPVLKSKWVSVGLTFLQRPLLLYSLWVLSADREIFVLSASIFQKERPFSKKVLSMEMAITWICNGFIFSPWIKGKIMSLLGSDLGVSWTLAFNS